MSGLVLIPIKKLEGKQFQAYAFGEVDWTGPDHCNGLLIWNTGLLVRMHRSCNLVLYVNVHVELCTLLYLLESLCFLGARVFPLCCLTLCL